jgi:hypothetical protein
MARNYWIDLFTPSTWQEFLAAGANVSGFRKSSQALTRQIQPGDYLLCYLVYLSRWIGILEVISEPYEDTEPIWQDDVFPCRVKVKVITQLTFETAVPVHDLKGRLSIYENITDPRAIGNYLRRSPSKWKSIDGEAVVEAIMDAARNPISRPVDQGKLALKPKLLKAKALGAVTVPDTTESSLEDPSLTLSITQTSQERGIPDESFDIDRELTQHTEIQWLLLRLGSDMGFDVWVARNDRHREANGQRFADLPRLKKDLPLQFDDATNRTIEHIDVLWLKGNAVVAAFEIESTTSIYSGLLRMSDLIAMQPNLNIPLYLVAPEERRSKVIIEVNRPTFSRLSPPMNRMCKFIPFSALRSRIAHFGNMVRYLKPEFLDELAESCELAEV